MQISEFSRRTGLSRDTVRFYVRLGLLKPKTSAKGGSNPYQLFSDDDLQLAEVIRIPRTEPPRAGEDAGVTARMSKTVELLNSIFRRVRQPPESHPVRRR